MYFPNVPVDYTIAQTGEFIADLKNETSSGPIDHEPTIIQRADKLRMLIGNLAHHGEKIKDGYKAIYEVFDEAHHITQDDADKITLQKRSVVTQKVITFCEDGMELHPLPFDVQWKVEELVDGQNTTIIFGTASVMIGILMSSKSEGYWAAEESTALDQFIDSPQAKQTYSRGLTLAANTLGFFTSNNPIRLVHPSEE